MTEVVRRWVETQARRLEFVDPIVEFGAQQVPGQEGLADMRAFFSGFSYIGADMEPGTGVDVIDDAEHSSLPDGTMGVVLCLETLEHVAHPWKAAGEFHRILKPAGLLLISVPWRIRIHNYPSDYWRMTPAALEMLLCEAGFREIEVTISGDEEDPDTIFAIARR